VNRFSFGVPPLFKLCVVGVLGFIGGSAIAALIRVGVMFWPPLLFLDPIMSAGYWLYFSVNPSAWIPVIVFLIHSFLGMIIAMWMARKIVGL